MSTSYLIILLLLIPQLLLAQSKPSDELQSCVAVRGNGDRVLSSLYALARLSEHYGPFDAIAGSSSGSIVSFLYESARSNPAVSDCGQSECGRLEQGLRLSLALKSLQGYFSVLKESPEVQALLQLQVFAQELQSPSGQSALNEPNLRQAGLMLGELFQSPRLGALVDPEFRNSLVHPQKSELALQWLKDWQAGLGKWSTTDPAILFRPAPVNYFQVAFLIGRLGSFLAGEEMNPSLWRSYFEKCSATATGRVWSDFYLLDSCGEFFEKQLARPFTQLAQQKNINGRISAPVGAQIPVLVSTSALVGDSYYEFLSAQEDFLKGNEFSFHPQVADLRSAYWGPKHLTQKLEAQFAKNKDAKLSMALDLGQPTWQVAMAHSIAEPGLSPALDYNHHKKEVVTTGGWMDLHSVLALKTAGCKKVVYITRAGGESDFARGAYALVGGSKRGDQRIFDLNTADSSVQLNLKAADAVYCTGWDRYDPIAAAGDLIRDAYFSPLQTQSEFFTQSEFAYSQTHAHSGLPGCEAGLGN